MIARRRRTTLPQVNANGSAWSRHSLLAGLLSLPLVGLLLLVARPALDRRWEHHPAHLWLVFGAAMINAVIAYAMVTAAARRWDARVYLVALAFLAAAGFLGLHALATPGVVLDAPNTGFAMATPIGLLFAAAFTAVSGVELPPRHARALMRRSRVLTSTVLGALLVWAILSLAGMPPLDDPDAPERLSGPLVTFAVVGIGLYAFAVVAYWRHYRRRRATVLLALVASCTLLAEAMVAVAVGRNWHASWWEWHVLMLVAFAVVALTAQRQWHEERFSGLYLDDTVAGAREVSVVFADLAGFTSFAERRDPREVSAMLNEYFDVAIPPIVDRYGGSIDRIIGDALMVVFNRRGDQPDHARRAAAAALAIRDATAAVAGRHDGWPRARIGVNSGAAVVAVVGTGGGRTHTVLGDTVNVASRLQAAAPVGGVVVGAETVRQAPGVDVQPLGPIRVKGKQEPVEAYLLTGTGPARPGSGAGDGS